MTTPVTLLAPIKLAQGKSESDLLAASRVFQTEFASKHRGILRRELVRTDAGTYLDIVQFSSEAEAMKIMELEATSTVCHTFFSVMDLSEGDAMPPIYTSLQTFLRE